MSEESDRYVYETTTFTLAILLGNADIMKIVRDKAMEIAKSRLGSDEVDFYREWMEGGEFNVTCRKEK